MRLINTLAECVRKLRRETKPLYFQSRADRLAKAIVKDIEMTTEKEDQNQPPEERRNAVFVDEKGRCLKIMIYDAGEDSLPTALGALELAKDVAKQQFSMWRAKDAQRKGGILVPGKNGNLRVN